MGQKVNAKAFRLGPIYTWDSRWFAEGDRYKKLVLEDAKIRKLLESKLKRSSVGKLEIERSINKIEIIIHTAKPGMVIGRGGKNLEEVNKLVSSVLEQKNKGKETKLEIKVEPIKKPDLDATIVAQNIADRLEKRIRHRRVIHQAMDRVMEAGAKGVKVTLSGRIAGAEISRREKYKEGKVPLSTIRAEIDFAKLPALTRSGYIGIKVWICK
ncbi:30S ribosomal protein S3 [Candidatus Microgenomates bacterium]|nr:30S ribosomal protein S3 [Candidatus Microgenomates bacterium]